MLHTLRLVRLSLLTNLLEADSFSGKKLILRFNFKAIFRATSARGGKKPLGLAEVYRRVDGGLGRSQNPNGPLCVHTTLLNDTLQCFCFLIERGDSIF